jgi:hypothetical protein
MTAAQCVHNLEHLIMRATIFSLTGIAAFMLMTGCNHAKSPEAAAKDIAAANTSAAKEVSDAQRDRQKDMSADTYDVTVARADGDHKIAIQKCETLQGHDQQLCKDQADADYEAAKANAKATKVAQQP